jgi:hypothetical protein
MRSAALLKTPISNGRSYGTAEAGNKPTLKGKNNMRVFQEEILDQL